MSEKLTHLKSQDYQNFFRWIDLNLDVITWQGKFKKDFEDFINLFFLDNLTLLSVMKRFDYAFAQLQTGPVYSWFLWLKKKIIVYCFIKKQLSILELSKQTDVRLSEIASILRDFFVEKFPEHEDYLNLRFQVSNVMSPYLEFTIDQLCSDIQLNQEILDRDAGDLLSSLEITLYQDWQNLLKKLRFKVGDEKEELRKIKSQNVIQGHIKFIQEVVFLFLIGTILVYGLKFGNKWYEKYLTERINLFQPQFFWLDKDKNFEVETKVANVGFDLKKFDEIPELLSREPNFEEKDIYEVESDVTLSSVDSLPKDITSADNETSEFEEEQRTGYRDSAYGNKRVYRVMMKSQDIEKSKTSLTQMLSRFGATQVDLVKPGTMVPGGLYYNLYVPTEYLNEFLSGLTKVDESVLYVSRTKNANPAGKSRVFIWIKVI